MQLNPEQNKAVLHTSGPLLIVAGAGTGKTAVITERIAWLIREKKAKSDEILALTFTEKAAGEMEERLDRALPMGYVDVWVMTFHAFGERVLREHGLDIGIATNFKILSTAEQWLLIRRNLDAFDLTYYKPLGNPTKFLGALAQHISRAKDEGITPEEYAKAVRPKKKKKRMVDGEWQEEYKRSVEIVDAYATYERLLRERGNLDFGDLILQTLRLFKTRRAILAEYQKRFKYILVDEFQDTNLAQYALVKLLTKPKNNITVVGDDDQSIYKFRGAALSNILEFKKDFPTSTEVVLTENYRSRQAILNAAYRFIQHNNPNRLESKLSQAIIGAKGKVLTKRVVKKLHATRTGTGTLEHLSFPTADEETEWLVSKIMKLKNANPNISWNEFAVLTRANSQAERFVSALAAANVPCHFVASKGLFQRPEILNILALLRLLDSYHESGALYRFMTSGLFDFSSADVSGLLRAARQKHSSLFAALNDAPVVAGLSDAGRTATSSLLNLLETLSRLSRNKPVSRVLLEFFKTTKYLDRFHRDTEHDKIMNIAKFWRRVRAFEETADDKTVRAFMEEMTLATEIGEDATPAVFEEGPDAVRIMTVHGAKGLEFSYVFLPQLIDQRFPSNERSDTIPFPEKLIGEIVLHGDAHLEEERRLFYVALTRAKDGVFLTAAEDYGGNRKRKPSRFLFELGVVQAMKKSSRSVQQPFQFPSAPDDQPPQKHQHRLPAHFSFTQLKAFETCPKQYHYAHILMLPVDGKPVFSFGKSIHGTLKDFYQRIQEGAQPSEQELLAMYERNWITDWYASDEEEARRKDAGKKALKEFYTLNKASFGVMPIALEQDFHLKVGSYMLKGRIDRIDKANGEGPMANGEKPVTIIDYKTGAMPKSKKAEDLDQLLMYAIAAREVLGFVPKQLVYYYLETNTPIVVGVDETKFPKLKETILAIIEKIKASDFQATPGFVCKTCDFRDICEDRAV